jgi:hypothetical protein
MALCVKSFSPSKRPSRKSRKEKFVLLCSYILGELLPEAESV